MLKRNIKQSKTGSFVFKPRAYTAKRPTKDERIRAFLAINSNPRPGVKITLPRLKFMENNLAEEKVVERGADGQLESVMRPAT